MGDKIPGLCKRVYQSLQLSGYARIDMRTDNQGRVWVIEANPNPSLAQEEDFAQSAAAAGMDYDSLIQAILEAAC